MKQKIAVIGDGNVGSALAKGLTRAGHEVRTTGKDPKKVRDDAAWGEIVILAVPWSALDDVVKELGDAAKGKILVDVTNALNGQMQLAIGFTTSGAEELAKKAPSSHVVKAFNTVFAQNMSTGTVKGEKIGAFVAGDDSTAREKVLGIARDIGFDAVDAGRLVNSRWLETLGYLNIQLGYGLKMGPGIGFRLVH